MHLTITFVTSFEFVIWTIPSSITGSLPSSLYTFTLARAWLGITTIAITIRGFPEFDRYTSTDFSIDCPLIVFISNNIFMVMNKITNCTVCRQQLKGKQTMFCSIKCKNTIHQSYPSQKKRGLTRKLEIISQFGNKCTRCGYNKNLSALSFHHLKDKDFKLDLRSLSNRTIARVMQELDKCILLCHNCHSEVHNPELDLEKLSLSRLL